MKHLTTRNGYVNRSALRKKIFLVLSTSLAAYLMISLAVLFFAPPDEEAMTAMTKKSELAVPPTPLVPPEEARDATVADAHNLELSDHIHAIVREGETLGDILRPWLAMTEILNLSESCKDIYSFSKMRTGQAYTVHMGNEGELIQFEYEADRESKIVVRRENSSWVATTESIAYDIKLCEVKGVIFSNLFTAIENAEEHAALAVMLAEIFAWEIDFIKSIQKEDNFRLLVEKRWRNGEFRGYGSILAAEFTNQGITYDAYQFIDSTGGKKYFNATGESLRRAFLKAPLAFKRISSPYDLKRLHPILGTAKPHPAIDYAAPTGTPIMAIGNGTVATKSTSRGNGNYILLRHHNGYTSMYLHMSRFAKGIVQGGTVLQGDVIGYVGSTGLATGPHLCFRMTKDGNPIDPGKLLSPRDEFVGKAHMDSFIAQRDILKGYLSGERALTEYSPEQRG